jgi:pimeloyl-ACP methyl ester carboxylesterase
MGQPHPNDDDARVPLREDRRALSSIHVPTLAIAREEDLDFQIDQVRETAARIVGATLSAGWPW